MVQKGEILRLYKQYLRTASRFGSFNYREYFGDRIRYGFKQHMHEKDPKRVEEFVSRAKVDLEKLERQVALNRMFSTTKLVFEN
eukprot:Nk52_evm8s2152 gene=Nk52_evmTU8s2152